MNRLKCFSIGLFILTLFPSCASDVVCDCWDDCDRALVVEFDTSKQNGFSMAEIDSIRIFTLDNNLNQVDDTLIFMEMASNKYYFGNCSPEFGFDIHRLYHSQGGIYRNYDVVTNASDTFRLRDIIIEGRTEGTCNCYQLDKKTLKVDGVLNDFSLTLSNTSGVRHVVLRKK